MCKPEFLARLLPEHHSVWLVAGSKGCSPEHTIQRFARETYQHLQASLQGQEEKQRALKGAVALLASVTIPTRVTISAHKVLSTTRTGPVLDSAISQTIDQPILMLIIMMMTVLTRSIEKLTLYAAK